jgi:hypothetical protein
MEFRKSIITKYILSCFLLFFTHSAFARVFDFKNERFASLFRTSTGPSTLLQKPFADGSGSGLTFDGTIKLNNTYGFGFVYATPVMNLILGLDAFKSEIKNNISATDASGVKMYRLASDLSGYIPKIGLEFNLKTWSDSKFYIVVSGGSAVMTLQNTYQFTTEGLAAYSGMADYKEEAKGTASLYENEIGYEKLLSDSTTMVFAAGYRQFNIQNFKHNLAVTTFNGAVVKGDELKNTDGTNRTLDLSGYFAAIAFRFYIY